MGGSSSDNPTLAPSQRKDIPDNSQGFSPDEKNVYNDVTMAKKTMDMSPIGAMKTGGMSKVDAAEILTGVGEDVNGPDEELSPEENTFVQNLFNMVKGKRK